MRDYTPLVRVEVKHDYFQPESLVEHRLEPSPATMAFLQRGGFRWVSDRASHTLYADSRLVGPAARRPGWLGQAPGVLCFCFEPTWRDFGWVTALPATEADEVLVYAASLVAGEDGPTTAEGPVAAALRSRGFPFHMGASSGAEASVTDGWGRPAVHRDQGTAGYYRVGREGLPPQPVLVEPSLALHRPMLVLVLGDLVPALGAGKKRRPGPTRTVLLHLLSRATTWRYHVFNHAGDGRGYRIQPAMHNGGGDALGAPRFRRVSGVRGPSGELSVSFESERRRPIPLRRRPRERFQLVGAEGVLMQPLPVPGPALARGAGASTYCSDMMVYL